MNWEKQQDLKDYSSYSYIALRACTLQFGPKCWILALFVLLLATCSILSLCWLTLPYSSLLQSKASCPLWHIMKENGKCECSKTYDGTTLPIERSFIHVYLVLCGTLNAFSVETIIIKLYRVSMNSSGEALNKITCGGYSR